MVKQKKSIIKKKINVFTNLLQIKNVSDSIA